MFESELFHLDQYGFGAAKFAVIMDKSVGLFAGREQSEQFAVGIQDPKNVKLYPMDGPTFETVVQSEAKPLF